MSKPFRAPRKNPSQTRSKQMVDAIVEAATRVFSEASFDGATTNHIASRAGISVGSLYQYFPNKSAILLATWRRHLANTFHGVARSCEEECSMPWPAAFRHTVGAAIRNYTSNRMLWATFCNQLPTDLLMPNVAKAYPDLAAAKKAPR